ncbi:molybdopterin dinucleotide binding domain-containing protein [Azospirillum brasilense]|uniref:molybdopterin dinucleotide binding domain-containing protein n=1 Tax=Azospirillum brasilense TaxID=192 RepID=UPI001FFFD5EE|nr:molybdopterin dinucleotide binding domain-containing protein [Azospirillum brasilense]
MLNTGRLRDHWHTMTRTGLSPRLSAHAPEPCLDLHPRDAAARGLTDGALVNLPNRLIATIQSQSLTTVQEVGEALRAGTNCGSCIPELKEILADAQRSHVA